MQSKNRRKPSARSEKSSEKRRVRYAVIGLGYIAQAAVLPAFAKARNSELAALISNDPVKLKKLSKKYKVPHTSSYEDYEECLRNVQIDAVYIALPNNMHREYSVRASALGVHVLCEKPMAVTEAECDEMIEAAERGGAKLMVAYRLHFEEANLRAVELAQSGKLGDVRAFNSVFTMQVKEGDIRLNKELGGGTLYDIGIYCINAARYIFRDEPIDVFAFSANNGESRFRDVDEMTSAVMRFPQERLAAFTCSFGASDISAYQVVGTRGHLRVDPAYEFAEALKHDLTINGKQKTRTFSKRDQFAPELIYFSDCILNGKTPEPSGEEGLADVRIIQALYRSATAGVPVELPPFERRARPTIDQEIEKPPVKKPELVHAAAPSRDR